MTGQPLRYLSLFSGIGGFDLGFDRAGMVCAGQVEIDDYCRRVLAKHWPDVKRKADIREVQGDEFGTVDVICGGFPCQPHSYSGKRQGAADDRNLWPEYCRLIASIRPSWVIGENVPGIVTTIIDSVLSDLDSLGYTTTALVIPACAVDAPHIRERVFIVAHTDGSRREAQPEQLQEPERATATVTSRGRVAGGNGKRGQGTPLRWQPESGMDRVAHGVSHRVDRVKALGNAVVPQVAEWLGRRIVAAEMEVSR